MSLNHKEIDLVLSELDLEGARIQRIVQPSYDLLVLGLYKSGKESDLLISIAHGACRLHALSSPAPKPQRPLRFQECLKSRIRGGRIESVVQLGDERIVRFDITVARVEADADRPVYKVLGSRARDAAAAESGRAEGGEPRMGDGAQGGPEILRYRLYARLWSGAGNILLADESGTLIDVLARRPKRGEISGAPCAVEETLGAHRPGPVREFAVRDLPPVEVEGGGSFNERVEAYYAARGGELSRERLLETARERFARRRRALEARIAELDRLAAEYRDADRLRELGDILMANQGAQITGRLLACEDFFRNGEVAIEIDPRRSILDNARTYYDRYRKAHSGLADVEAELAAVRSSLAAEEAELARIESMEEPLLMARALAKGGTARAGKKRAWPGLSLERKGWTILVGRSAKENDELLRRHVRGSDLWMHARDFAGSYVFVKGQAGKSFPLDILLDAGNLAIYYSKGRSNGGGELYYTLAKYLRRAKDGPKGLVLPSHEKNLHITLEEGRLRELKALMGDEENSR